MSYKINDPESGVIQSPNGEIQYYTKSIDNKHNPYTKKNLDNTIDTKSDKDNIEYAEVACNGTIIVMPVTDINSALILESRACIIRCFCIFDLVINIYIALNCYYASLFSVLITTVSLMGYTSTITYNKKGLILYLSYHYFKTISKIMLLTMYIYILQDQLQDQLQDHNIALVTDIYINQYQYQDQYQEQYLTIITNSTIYVEITQLTAQLTTQNVCILAMITTVEMYITYVIQRFYNLLPSL